MVAHTSNPSSQEAEARGSPVSGQPELPSKTFCKEFWGLLVGWFAFNLKKSRAK